MQVTVTPAPAVIPPPTTVTLTCSVEEAQTIYDILGMIGVREYKRLVGTGSATRANKPAWTDIRNEVQAAWNALHACPALKQYDEAR